MGDAAFVCSPCARAVTLWANQNPTVTKPELKLIGDSEMSREVCNRFGVPFKNQSVGAATKLFKETHYHPLGDHSSALHRKKRDATERTRLSNLFNWKCGICQQPVKKQENYEIDHKVRWELTHDDSDGNLQLSHKLCHDAKSTCLKLNFAIVNCSLPVATTAVRSLTRTCRIWRSDASGEASGR